MKRILLTVAYDGTGYSGFQAQKSGVPTIERELNRALTDLTGAETEVSGASRTDAGVHALCNLAVFDTESRRSVCRTQEKCLRISTPDSVTRSRPMTM